MKWSMVSVLSLAVFTLAVGCGSSDTSGQDGGGTSGEDTGGGGNEDAGGGTPDSGGNSTCNTVGETCSNGGCYLQGTNIECLPEGTKTDAESCVTANDCVLMDQCLTLDNKTECFPICNVSRTCATGDCTDTGFGFSVCVVTVAACQNAGDSCSLTGGGTGVCVKKVDQTLFCAERCTTAGDACKNGETCYLLDANSFACLTTGTKNVGDACGGVNECKAGLQCLTESGTSKCYQICSQSKPCPSGTCTDTGLGLSVCV